MKLIYDNGNPCNSVLVYEHNGHKFRSHCDHKNGYWDCSLSIMANDGTWKQIETNKSLNVEWENLYFLNNKQPTKCAAANMPVVEAFEKYIESIY
jgi:hypothetical protein